MRNLLFVLIILGLGAGAWWLVGGSGGNGAGLEFGQVGQITADGNIADVQVSSDGNLLASINTTVGSIDLFDIGSPTAPLLAGRIELPGKPTAVSLSPDGTWALATLYLEDSHPYLPGGLAVVDISDAGNPRLNEIIGVGHEPVDVSVAASGADLVAVVAVANSPMLASVNETESDISLSGQVQVITLNPSRAHNYSVAALDLSAERLTEAGLDQVSDARPTSVTLSPDSSLATAALSGNGGIVVFDPYWLEVRRMFAAGPGTQHVAFTPAGNYLLSTSGSDEQNTVGDHGFATWTLDGEAQSGGPSPAAVMAPAVTRVHAARFGQQDFAFAVAANGAEITILGIGNPLAPQPVQTLASAGGNISVATAPERGLLVVATEQSGEIRIYERSISP